MKPTARSSANNKFKLAIEPKVVLPSEKEAVDEVIEGKSDLAYTVEMEIVPTITLADFKTLKLTWLTAEVTRRRNRSDVADDCRAELAVRSQD